MLTYTRSSFARYATHVVRLVRYHIAADSATAYGLPTGHAISSDGGQSWQVEQQLPSQGGLLLPNGDRLRSVSLLSLELTEVSLPEPVGTVRGTYGSLYRCFRAEERSWPLTGAPAFTYGPPTIRPAGPGGTIIR